MYDGRTDGVQNVGVKGKEGRGRGGFVRLAAGKGDRAEDKGCSAVDCNERRRLRKIGVSLGCYSRYGFYNNAVKPSCENDDDKTLQEIVAL